MRNLGKVLLCLGLAAQALVPGWMVLKRHLILTRGERVTLKVTVYDPRDLFMGHYVQLHVEELPPILKGIPRNYLRYYCDQRYAMAIDRGTQKADAELDVRVWRGCALAEALRIGGMPAYAYAREVTQGRTPTVPPPTPKKTVIRFGRFRVDVPPMLAEGWGWSRARSLREQGYTHVQMPVNTLEVWRLARKRLGLLSGPPLTPPESRARQAAMRAMSSCWGRMDGCCVIPLFDGFAFPCARPFAEQAAAYYDALQEACGGRLGRVALEATRPLDVPAKDAWEAAKRAFPEAELFLHGTAVPEGIPPERVALILPALPDTPPTGVRWMVAGVADAPKGSAGRVQELTLLPPLEPSTEAPQALLTALRERRPGVHGFAWQQQAAETFAAVALKRYEETRNPKAREVLDALLMRIPERTLHAYFTKCPNYEAYRELVDGLSHECFRTGRPPLLGGWLSLKGETKKPPEPPPPINPTVEDLLSLGEAALAL